MNYTVSVIIPTYYTGDVLFGCILSCIVQEGVNEVIVVNNGNPEVIEKELEILCDQYLGVVQIITGHGNIGFAKACNLGAKSASSDFVLFLNPDCVVNDDGTFLKILRALSYREDYVIGSCKILNKDGTIQKTCRRNLLTPLIALSESLGIYKIFRFVPGLNLPIEEIEQLDDVSEVPAISGAVVMMRAKDYISVGGFDEAYFLHVEDMDLCMRIFKLGQKIIFVKSAEVVHFLSTSQKTSISFLEKHKAKGFIYYLESHFAWCKYFPINFFIKTGIWLRCFIKSLCH